MKKLLSILALALCFVACQNEAVESVNNGDLANVVLTIDAPELGVTRADGDANAAKNSAFGAIDFLTDADWDNYDLRYILEVYAENEGGTGEPIYRERLVNCLDKYAPTTFELRLVPERTYKFVVFADFVAEGNAELTEPAAKRAIRDLYYDTTDLRNITSITDELTWGAMNEIRDAYFVTENVQITNGLNKTLTLTRPFAKLRVIATDLDYIAGYSKPGYVEVAYHTEKIYKSFNAVNGKLNTTEMTGEELKYNFDVNKNIPYTAGYDEFSTNQTLFTDYLLAVEGEQTTVNFTIAVYEDATKTRKIHEHDFNTQIPIQRNHLTTLIGDILTTQANITIEIDDNFADPEYVVGYKDPNLINAWESGVVNTDGNFEFTINKGENEFTVIVNGAAVQNKQLTVGNYVWEPNADDAEDGSHLTFTVKNLPATRTVATAEVLDGTMNVAVNKDKEGEYIITLDLLTENNDGQTHRSVYEYTGAILFGETLDTPVVETKVEGNTITVSWTAVDGATSYFVAMNGEEAVETTELSKVYTDLEWETEYTFSVYAKSDTLISVTATVEATTEAAPVVEEGYKLYFNNLANWSKVYAHIWANDGEDLGLESVECPGRELTETEELNGVTYYVFQLPAEATGKTVNVVFNDGAGLQTKDLEGVVEGNLFFDNYVEPIVPSDVVLYLQPNTNWNADNARFAAYFFGNGETWVDMTLVEGETNIYAVTVPAGFEKVIFCRMNPGAAANNWTNKWNQTENLTVPTDGTNLYTVKEGTWDNGGGEWSVYAPAVVEPTLTIAEVLKVDVNTAVNTAGQVMAVYQKGFIMSDNTGTIVVYTDSAPSVKVGNNIAVSGTFDNYYGTLQIASPTITENDNATTAPVYPTPIDLTEEAAYDVYETFGTDKPTTFPYVKIKGTLSNDRYITVGTSTKQSMFNYSNSDYSAMNGKTITTVAYIIGYHSSGGYYQLVETSVEAEPYISAPENVNVAADATSATINVSANVVWNVTCDANWVTFEKTATSISVTFEANNGDERTARFTLSGEGVDAVIVTLTQAAYGATDTKGTYTSGDFLFKDKTVTNTSTGQTQGTNAYKQSMKLDDVSTIDVLKLGTSSKAGSFETAAVGVSGKSKLSFYAVAWKGKTAKLTVTVDGKATELTLKANTGATGNPPYNDSEGALEFNDDTDYYTVDVTGITADSTVTFATDNTGYRALICGVQLY